jgi:Putative peptidoglycan binding domain
MKPFLSLSIALAVAAGGHPLYAASDKDQKEKDQKAQSAAHAAPQKGAAVASHRPSSPVMAEASKPGKAAHGGAETKIARSENTRERSEAAPNVAVQRGKSGPANLATQQNVNVNGERNGRNQTSSVALGGRTAVNSRSDNQVVINNPPVNVYQNWDHGRVHDWDHHHYRWNNGAWIIIDPSYGYYGGVAPYPGYSGGSGSVVSEVQSALDQNGYHAGPPDGVVGPGTRSAIAAFQSDHGLPATGQINPPLLHTLGVE